MVEAELVTTAHQAIAAAARLDSGRGVVLKVCSPDIAHKSEAGGVALGIRGDDTDAVRTAYVKVVAAGQPSARIEGVLVSPMAPDGVELLAGISRDPAFGPVLTLGLGGIWVEVLKDAVVRPLPVTSDDVRAMLGELRGAALLHGARGTEPADLDAVADAVTGLTHAALALGERLDTVEINPLRVRGGDIQALDALIVTTTAD